ncbi:deoxynucleoside kinase [Patescibacteria group bacterium]|nr:deoxynucleoside kinase [Patescibacteria group bacterium]
MIIAFDGNVYTGKTTLIDNLIRYYSYNKISEYSNFFSEDKINKHKEEHLIIQNKYLEIDVLRKKFINHNKINLLDRSFISLTAHIWTLYKIKIVDIRKEYLKKLFFLMDNNNIILPNLFVYVTCNYKSAKVRYKQNERISNAKKTLRYFIDFNYFHLIRLFNKRCSLFIPSLEINTDKNLIMNIIKVNKFINNNTRIQTINKEKFKEIFLSLLQQ